jgi:epoxyqueuosine reductase
MELKKEIKEKAKSFGFDLCGVSDLLEIEKAENPPHRGLRKPLEVMPEAKSLIILGFVVWDENFNSVVVSIPTSDRQHPDIYGFYYDIMESRAWRLCHWLLKEKGIFSIPTLEVQLKPAAMLAGLGFIGHNTQLITPEYGPRVRWIALLVNAELTPDAPFDRDLCAEQPLCQKKELCVKACPFQAIVTGPSQGVPPGEKVQIDNCVIFHECDKDLEKKWEQYIRRTSERGFMECTRCNVVCPYGKPVEDKIIPEKRGLL